MALRVLLADESTTIKKVMQLALQDFAVEVKAVHSGLDTLEVARAFQPDVVFADVLLPKRNGYDVAGDLKKDPQLKTIPVVLMWSSFMDLDEKAYLNAKANGKLEKPFDVENLRQLILELVPKTQTQRLAHFLRFPAAFAEPLEAEEAKRKEAAAPFADPSGAVHAPGTPPVPLGSTNGPATGATADPLPLIDPLAGLPPLVTKSKPPALGHSDPDPDEDSTSGWNIDSFEDLKSLTDRTFDPSQAADDEDEEPVRITKLGGAPKIVPPPQPQPKAQDAKPEDVGDPWAHQDLSRFKLDIPAEDLDRDEISIVFDMDEIEEPKSGEFLLNTRKNENTGSVVTGAPATRTSAKIKLPKDLDDENATSTRIRATQAAAALQGSRLEDTLPNPPIEGVTDADGLELETAPGPTPPLAPQDRHQPIGQIRHADGEMISQFEPHEQTVGLQLEAAGAAQNPQLSLDQLEAIVRAQSQDIIEALARKIVPDLAVQIIKDELERLVKDGGAG